MYAGTEYNVIKFAYKIFSCIAKQEVPSRFVPVDKSKNSAETHSGSSRTVNLEIAKDGIYHPLEV